MRYLLLLSALLLQEAAFCQPKDAPQPLAGNQVSTKFKEVTIAGLLWQLRDMYRKADCQVLDVVYFGRYMDVMIIQYDGSNITEIENGFNPIYNGDKVLIEARRKPPIVQTRCFTIKK